MIFRLFKAYRMTRKGIKDPTGLVVEELQETVMGVFIIPGIVLGVILILLGIFGFSNWITDASGVARVFFWIFLVIGIFYGIIATVIAKLTNKVLRKGESVVRPHVDQMRGKIDGSF